MIEYPTLIPDMTAKEGLRHHRIMRGIPDKEVEDELPELYQTATDFIIIHKGVIKKILTFEQLGEFCRHHILIRCNEPEKLVSILETELKTTNFKVMPDKSIRLYDYLDEVERVAKAIFDHGIMVTNLSNEGDTLESYFLSTIGGDRNV